MISTRIRLLHPRHFNLLLTILTAGILASTALSASSDPVVTVIGQNFTASTLNVDSSAIPPDANGAAGPVHFVELINGRFSVYNKSNGSKVKSMTDLAFWTQAGVTVPSGWDVTDPRIIYDPASQRWFASQVDFDPTGNINTNHFLVAVSATADPTGTWTAFSIATDLGGSNFADFPTLGLDAQGVYLSGDMFDTNSNPAGSSLVSIPKSALLASPPTVSGLTRFGILSYNTRGDVLEPAICFDGSGQGTILSTASVGIDVAGNFVTNNHLVLFQVTNASASGQAKLGVASVLTVAPYTAPFDPTQPDGTTNLDDGDARISAKVYEVGGILYAVHGTEINNLAALQWYRINAATQTILESGAITDPVMDLYYPSIAVNPSGTVVIAYDGSSISTFPSSFAVVGRTVNGVTSFSTPVLLKAGTASYQNTDSSGTSRWGDYGATCTDPTDPNTFWTIQEFASGAHVWSTQVTQLQTGIPELSSSVSGAGLALSWSGTIFTLQATTSLANPNWTAVTQNLATNNGIVTAQVPMTGASGFFRLQAP